MYTSGPSCRYLPTVRPDSTFTRTGPPTPHHWLGGTRRDHALLARYQAQWREQRDRWARSADVSLQTSARLLRQRATSATTTQDLIPEICVLVTEATRRALGLHLRDNQILAAIALTRRTAVQLATGEGKTLAAVIAAAIRVLTGAEGVHVVTANDYLAERDHTHTRDLYTLLGITTGHITTDTTAEQRRAAYTRDVTYTTAAQLGFDLLRDRTATHPGDRVQPPLNTRSAIVDEADAVLVDEATLPLILTHTHVPAGPWAQLASGIINSLTPGSDYHLEGRQTWFTEAGENTATTTWDFLTFQPSAEPHGAAYLRNALHARALLTRDRDYVITDDQIVLVDRHTGRPLPGRRLAGGLHQALEAKHHLPIRPEAITVAKTSIRALFTSYQHLAGTSGSLGGTQRELTRTYQLTVTPIAPHRSSTRSDLGTTLYGIRRDYLDAALNDLRETAGRGQPVLVICSTITDTQALSRLLDHTGLPHQVLTARDPQLEAHVLSTAGLPGAITLTTAMAGRGSDIHLGGPPTSDDQALYQRTARHHALAAGGLHVLLLGTHPTTRHLTQLRGRTARAGEPGTTRHLIHLADPALRPALTRRLLRDLATAKYLSGPRITHLVHRAHRAYERAASELRLAFTDLDTVDATHQHQFGDARDRILNTRLDIDDLMNALARVIRRTLHALPLLDPTPQAWELVAAELDHLCPGTSTSVARVLTSHTETHTDLVAAALTHLRHHLRTRLPLVTGRHQGVLLEELDDAWSQHLADLEILRDAIDLRALAGHQPAIEYAHEARTLLQDLEDTVTRVITHHLTHRTRDAV